jgi:fatty-acid desaturase
MTTQTNPNYSMKFNPIALGHFTLIHGMALFAFFPFAFSWSAVAVMFFLYWVTASLGICLGYHRFLTHRGFTAPKWVAYTIVFFGTLACQNGPIKWVGQHRMHHAGSDTIDDPHSAEKGFWWSHITWMIFTHSKFDDKKKLNDYTKDFSNDKYYQFLDKYFIHIQVAFGLILLAIGGLPWVVWGIFVRLAVVYHSTWFVNSAAHTFGYVTFPLKDDLACWWVGLLAWGEGWHNNHHAFPKSARHGLRPWEIDMTWWALCFLEKLGLAKNIKVAQLIPNPSHEKENVSTEPAFIGKMVIQAA